MKLKDTLLLATLISLLCFPGCDSDDPEKGVVIDDQLAHYTFENNANDLVGSNDGESTNVVYLNSGNNGLAAQFNANSYIHFPSEFDYRERTVSLWFKAIVVTDVLGIIYVCDNNFIDNGLTILSVGNDISGAPQLSFNACSESVEIAIQEGQWYHAVITVDAGNYAFYLDGEKVDNGDISDNTLHSANGESGALLGTSRTFDRFFTGQVDNMRVYDRVLSEEEVSAVYEDEN
jgi:hypothetical protein